MEKDKLKSGDKHPFKDFKIFQAVKSKLEGTMVLAVGGRLKLQ